MDEKYSLICYLLSENILLNSNIDTSLKSAIIHMNMQSYDKIIHWIPLDSIEATLFNYFEMYSYELNENLEMFNKFLKTTFGFIIKEANYAILNHLIKKVVCSP
jgi:hypothetical protein